MNHMKRSVNVDPLLAIIVLSAGAQARYFFLISSDNLSTGKLPRTNSVCLYVPGTKSWSFAFLMGMLRAQISEMRAYRFRTLLPETPSVPD